MQASVGAEEKNPRILMTLILLSRCLRFIISSFKRERKENLELLIRFVFIMTFSAMRSAMLLKCQFIFDARFFYTLNVSNWFVLHLEHKASGYDYLLLLIRIPIKTFLEQSIESVIAHQLLTHNFYCKLQAQAQNLSATTFIHLFLITKPQNYSSKCKISSPIKCEECADFTYSPMSFSKRGK